MFKVLLVDDEPMAIEALKIAADWEDYGFVVCGQCSNGQEALGFIEKEKPDLVLTDVTMPIMDGLELIRQVKDQPEFKDLIFIIVSGYDEFEYAKRAMKYGITHYLLKPVFKEDFLEVLLPLIPKLERDREYKRIFSNYPEINIGYKFDEFLAGSLSEALLLKDLNIDVTKNSVLWTYVSLLLDFKHSENSGDEQTAISLEIKYFECLLKSIPDSYTKGFHIYPIYNAQGSYGLVLCSSRENSPEELLKHIVQQLATIFNDKFYISTGSTVDKLADLKISRSESDAALNFRFFSPDLKLLLNSDIRNLSVKYSLDEISPVEELLVSFENIDKSSLLHQLQKLFQLFRATYTAPEIIELYLTNVVYKSFSVIQTMGGSVDNLPHIPNLERLADNSTSLNELQQIMEFYAEDFCGYALSLKDRNKKSDRDLVEEYIRENYRRSLTIKEIAQKLYLHPTYLGWKINKWFGCSFNEYIHSLRMEEAGRLLRSTDVKSHEIAESLGYSSYNYFLEQFVKSYSMKPSEYKLNKF